MAAEEEDDRPEMLVKLQERRERHRERSKAYRAGVVLIGLFLVLVGIVLSGPGIPGPGFAVIILGLFFLALEFDRAERLLAKAIVWADRAKERAENAPRWQKVLTGVLGAAALGGFIAAAILWDIPLLPV